MPVNGMNVGVDYSLMFYDGTSGTLLNMGDIQNVAITELKHDIKNMPYNDDPSYGYIPDGFRIEFTITRTGSDLEDFMVKADANFRAGSVQKPGFLNQTTTNPDGSVSRYQYQKMVLFMPDHGNISRDKAVTVKVEGYASRKVQIA